MGHQCAPVGPSAECAGAAVADEALVRAQAIAPTVPITAHLLVGGTVESIVRECRQDALIVVGRRVDRLGSAGRSVGGQVARKAKSPVVMVALSGEGGTPKGADGRVAVTAGGAKDPLIALEFAFRAASLRDVGVVVVWVGKPCVSSRQEARLMAALRQVQRSFPAVEVGECVVALPDAQALPAETRGAAFGSGWIKNPDRFASGTTRFDERWAAFGLLSRCHRCRSPEAQTHGRGCRSCATQHWEFVSATHCFEVG
jgi:hypothetical protein